MQNKVLIVGAGIAGSAVAFWLKQYGFDPTIIERKARLDQGGYAIDLRGIAVDVAKKMAVYDAICEMRTRIAKGQYVDDAGRIIKEEEGEIFGFRQDEEVEILRGDLVAILMAQIDEVPCYFNTEISKLTEHNEGIDVVFTNGKKASYDLVIGCDGLHSSIRKIAFSTEEYKIHDLGCFISIFSVPNYLQLDHTMMEYERDQKVIHISSDRDASISLAGFMFKSDQKPKSLRDKSAQIEFLSSQYQSLGWESNTILSYAKQSEDFYFDNIAQVKMTSWSKGGVVLVGDAGYCASPLSGQGTSLALVGAYVLAGELKNAKGNYKHALKNYDRVLKDYVEANQAFGEWNSTTYWLSKEKEHHNRTDQILERLHHAAHAIILPEYK